MEATVVIPTLNGRDRLGDALASLERQTAKATRVVVVDNASTDGTDRMLADEFPWVQLVRSDHNLGFGRAVNLGARAATGEVLVLINNDVVCEADFLERMCAPLADPRVAMVAGVLLQATAPALIDTAGLELDGTLRSWDVLANRPVRELGRQGPPLLGPCGGAAAYRLDAFRQAGGFDESLFAYWEDVDLAIRLREAGWRSASAPDARALHRHGATVGAASPRMRSLDAFGRGYILGKYRVHQAGWRPAVATALLDWPGLVVHVVFRRELEPLRARRRGLAAGRRHARMLPPPLHLASVPLREAIARQATFLGLRFTRRLPRHFTTPGAPTEGA